MLNHENPSPGNDYLYYALKKEKSCLLRHGISITLKKMYLNLCSYLQIPCYSQQFNAFCHNDGIENKIYYSA